MKKLILVDNNDGFRDELVRVLSVLGQIELSGLAVVPVPCFLKTHIHSFIPFPQENQVLTPENIRYRTKLNRVTSPVPGQILKILLYRRTRQTLRCKNIIKQDNEEKNSTYRFLYLYNRFDQFVFR